MNIALPDWSFSPEQAIALQQELRSQVIVADQLSEVRYVAGVDVGFEAEGTITRAAVAVLNPDDLQVCDPVVPRPFPIFQVCFLFVKFRRWWMLWKS
nr:endonuclease V [Leptolyngbya sp. Cla-17]